MEQLKLLAMTVVLTLLIWAGADTLVNETASVRVSFEVMPLAESDLLMDLTPAAKSQLFELRVVGPRRVVEEFQAREPLTVRLRLGHEGDIGPTTIALEKNMVKGAIAEQWGDFRKLSVLSVAPSSLPVVVDRLISADVDLALKSLTLAYDDAPQLKRSVTTVRLRESRYNEMMRGGVPPQIDLSAEVERLLRGKPTGQTTTVSVAIDPRAFGPEAAANPSSVEVTAAVKSQRMTAEIPTVPIKTVLSFANLAQPVYAVARDGTRLTLVTQTIRVTGPTDEVAKLVRGETRAFGFIQLKEADLQEVGAYRAWTPEFQLPQNIELVEEPQPIEFKLTMSPATDGNGDSRPQRPPAGQTGS
ncbi:MAG: hypothetical protein HY763_15825 [Planctomycetes bacterium]|nr:hypothetical protein [Planctomycetota bacterium]